MKQLKGTPFNISKTLIGRVTRRPIWGINRSHYILLSESRIDTGYEAIILLSRSPNISNTLCGVFEVQGADALAEGDVVAITGEGIVSVLYAKESAHNCLFVTDRCNCRCVMCPQQLWEQLDDYRIEMNLRLISLMDKNTPHLGITGGEPTLAKDGLLKIISECKKRLPKTALTLLSNGINFSDMAVVNGLASIKHPDLQIDVPLYADTDDLHNKIVGAKAFWKTIQGLYNLGSLGQRIGIRVVVHRMNVERLPQIASFIYHNLPFVYQVAFMEMETTGLAQENLGELWVDPFDYNDLLEAAIRFLHLRDINVSIYNAQLCVLKPTLWNFAKQSISDWKSVFLDECVDCSKKSDCGGVFATSVQQSRRISPMKCSLT